MPKFLIEGKKLGLDYLIFSVWVIGNVKVSLFYGVILEYFLLTMTRLFAACCDELESLIRSLFGVNFDDYANEKLGSLYFPPKNGYI